MYHALDYLKRDAIAINNKIKRLSNYGEPQEDFLYATLSEWKNGDERKAMQLAWEYYMNKSAILEKTRTVINRQGILEESKVMTNTKMPHPFIKKLTKQKINYLLKKPATFKHSDDKVVELLKEYFNKKFHKKLKTVGRDAIVKGISWVQAYYDEAGVLSFKRIPSEQVLPFWADEDHTELDGIVRSYEMTLYQKDGSSEQITKVEYFTPDGIWYYEMTNDGLVPDPEQGSIEGPSGHFKVTVDAFDEAGDAIINAETNEQETQVIEAIWDRVPYVAFKYNQEEVPLLNWVKAMIDDYDKNTSDTSDVLQDTPNSIKVVKNYDGADVETFNHNLNTYRTAFVAEDGDMKTLDVTIDTAAMENHLDRTRKDIHVFGNGIDTQETDLGNASGVSLAFRTMDLDTDMDDMGSEFAGGLTELAYFIQVDAINREGIDFEPEDIEVIFNTDTIINEKEVVDMAKSSVGVVSDKTIVAKHPWVEDVAAEQKLLDEERVKREDEEVEHTTKMEEAFGNNEPNEG